jgi:hypothetical protein
MACVLAFTDAEFVEHGPLEVRQTWAAVVEE